MKKIFLIVLLALISVSASARKSYITVYTPNTHGVAVTPDATNFLYMTGDVPDNIEGFEYDTVHHSWRNNPNTRPYSTGEILNVLSEYGYEVEFEIGCTYNLCFLLSKEISSGQTISKGDVNTDGEVNIADVNEVISLILGIVREHPEILKQIKK